VPKYGVNLHQWPEILRSKICCCSDKDIYGNYPELAWRFDGKFCVCGVCFKPHWGHLYECLVCKYTFIKCFRHGNFDPVAPICWDCLQDPDVPAWRPNAVYGPLIKPYRFNMNPDPVDITIEVPAFSFKDL